MAGDSRHKFRFEVKYLVPLSVKVAVMHDVAAMTRVDPHAAGGSYLVRSLYLDSLFNASYHEKMAGILRRSKFRIRTYGRTSSVRFLEIKERLSNRILKRKDRIDQQQYEDILNRRVARIDGSAVMREFWRRLATTQVAPLLTIEYRRQPFVGIADESLRVTFDTDVCVRRARSLEQGNMRYTVLPNRLTVLEIKFDRYMPHWIQTIVRKFSLRDTAYSKFCLGLDELARRGVIHVG